MGGMGIACVIAVCEFVWKSRKVAVEEKVRRTEVKSKNDRNRPTWNTNKIRVSCLIESMKQASASLSLLSAIQGSAVFAWKEVNFVFNI